jgi:VWFA-related protein
VVWAQQQQPQDIPDAPSASRPVQPFPTAPPASKPPDSAPAQPAPQDMPSNEVPRSQEPPRDDTPANPPAPSSLDQPPAESNIPSSSEAPSQTPKMPPVKTVPAGSVPPAEVSGSRDDLPTFRVSTNFVVVPVTVKDFQGRLVEGLLAKDFSVYENGVKQQLRFFTSDPFPLSAAIIIDVGMPDVTVQKINETYTALVGAFTPYDELSLYTVSARASRVADFSAVNQQLTAKLTQLKTARGANNGPPVTSGPLGPQGPMVNGRPLDPGGPLVVTPPKVARVLNDAILMAAVDLNKRERTRRKIIFVISDGREYGSTASYKDVLKVLLTNDISVYGVGVGSAAIPVYNKLQRIRIPKMGLGYTDILPKYSSATGGQVFNEYSRQDIEAIYSRALGDARNQYTLGYSTKATPSTAYRQIEVRIAKPNLKVYAKDGYYPAAPLRR